MAFMIRTPTGAVYLSPFARAVLSRPGHRRLTFPGYVCKYCELAIKISKGDMWVALAPTIADEMRRYCAPQVPALVIGYHTPRKWRV